MPVKLAVSSFPAGEYGYLKGTVKSIGADALESTDQQSADRQRANTFPMTIELTDNEDKSVILIALPLACKCQPILLCANDLC